MKRRRKDSQQIQATDPYANYTSHVKQGSGKRGMGAAQYLCTPAIHGDRKRDEGLSHCTKCHLWSKISGLLADRSITPPVETATHHKQAELTFLPSLNVQFLAL